VEVIVDHFDCPSGTGERTQMKTFVFPRRVSRTWVALTGYSAQYDEDDHHVQRLTVLLAAGRAERRPEGWPVQVFSEFNLRDENGDDYSSGRIGFVLFVELESLLTQLLSFLGFFRSS
jgi:hypothetical protein